MQNFALLTWTKGASFLNVSSTFAPRKNMMALRTCCISGYRHRLIDMRSASRAPKMSARRIPALLAAGGIGCLALTAPAAAQAASPAETLSSVTVVDETSALPETHAAAWGASEEDDDGGGAAGIIMLIGAGAGVGAGAWYIARQRKTGTRSQRTPATPPSTDPLDQMSVEDLRSEAGSLLIAADDAIHSSEQEMGFAIAAYGPEAVETFREDIDRAKEHMSASFRLQNQLDDEVPDSEAQQRAWLKEIINRCNDVDESLSAHEDDFDELRNLETQAPDALPELREDAKSLKQPVEDAEHKLTELKESYTPEALAEVTSNVEEARERLTFVQTAITRAEESLAESDMSAAALAIRAGEDAEDQVRTLTEAISKTGPRLKQLTIDVREGVQQSTYDLSEAQALIQEGKGSQLAGPTAALEQVLEDVKSELDKPLKNPARLLRELEQAHRDLDEPLSRIRDRQEQAHRASQALRQALDQAKSKIEGTQDFISARRGGVGSAARTKLAEADRALGQAIEQSGPDPISALNLTHRASELADRASQIAQNDVNGWHGGGSGGGRGSVNGMGGAMLGGILMDSMMRGGRRGYRGGSWGGRRSGGFGGGFGGGIGGGGGRPGRF